MSAGDAAGDALGPLGREIAAGIGKAIGDGLTIMARAFHLWPCGCLINDAGAHRAGCPDHPEGVRG